MASDPRDEPTQPYEPEQPANGLPPKLPPVSRRVDLNTDSFPLPLPAPERDPLATRATARAGDSGPNRASPEVRPFVAGKAAPATPPRRRVLTRSVSKGKRVLRFILVSLIVIAVLGLVAAIILATYGIYQYYQIAKTLPDINDINSRAAQFESTYIYDSGGALLYEINDPNKGRRTRIPLDKISPALVAATIATEDRDYYSHPGFDALAILKAVYRAYRYGGEFTGASTITQQLTRALYLRLAECDKPDAPTACYEHSFDRKLREIILAAEINRRYTKDQILELYLNEIYYGNLDYGIEAAAETYFGKDAASLTLSEAAFLAGLPQAPATYDVYTNRDAALNRQKQVLLLMLAAGGDCSAPNSGIAVSNSAKPVCVTPSDAATAILEIQSHTFTPPVNDAKYPHWVDYIRLLLETRYGPELYRSGYRVYTTLVPALQDLAEAEVKKQVDSLADSHVTDAALVAIDPPTGRIIAMVGSNDYADPVDGQINMAIRPRQPGSSIKPLTYAAAFQKGWTPATLLWDIPTRFPDGANPPYEPQNYDSRFHGLVRVRDALANSYNIPAVKALQFVGVYDDPKTPQPDGLIEFARALGVTTLTRPDYGLALTLGGGEVTPLELTGAYATFANGGKRVFPVALARIQTSGGAVVCDQFANQTALDYKPCQQPPDNWNHQAIRAEHAYLLSDILADNHARSLAFGPNSALRLSFPAAVKTGTTNDYRDNWTIGYTPNLVVGVWVGNADFTPMAHGVSGVTGAGPIWHNVMEGAWAALGTGVQLNAPAPFAPPPGLITANICAVTGAAVNDYCQTLVDPRRPNESPVITETFAADQPPLTPGADLVAKAFIDKFSGLFASNACPNDWEEKEIVNISDPAVLDYLEHNGAGQTWAALLQITFPVTLAPPGPCTEASPRAVVSLVSPSEGQTLDGVIQIFGLADVTHGDFDHFIVDYGLSHDPGGWASVLDPNTTRFPQAAYMGDWDTAALPDGPATLRLVLFDKAGHSAEARIHVTIQHPTPVPPTEPPPTDTAIPTETPTVTLTPPASATPTDTPAATATSTSTSTLLPSDTPTPMPTDAPSPTPTDTPIP
ncbi:MAG: transglycosylase domain-containing protein [Chloroflexi bacterium]|nr:transglycosylase domain-containing protein [Chloroflexota bacterium]